MPPGSGAVQQPVENRCGSAVLAGQSSTGTPHALDIEARFGDGEGGAERDGSTIVATVDRPDKDFSQPGLTLAEDRSLLVEVQSELVSQQTASWLSASSHCPRFGSALSHNDSRSIGVRTVFGEMVLNSPRLLSCACETAAGADRHYTSPLCEALSKRLTPELEYLQVIWADHLPFRQPLPCSRKFFSWTKATRSVAKARDASLLPSRDCEYSALWWDLQGIAGYLRKNAPVLVNDRASYRKGLPISCSIAELAVNPLVRLRMAMKRQMRRTDAGAHCLLQIRVAVLNAELSPSRRARLVEASNARPRMIPNVETRGALDDPN